MKNFWYFFSFTLIAIGVIGIIDETFCKYLIKFFSLPFILPISLVSVGIYLFYQIHIQGIFIDTEGKTDYEVDKEVIKLAQNRGYTVKKDY